MIKNYMEEVVDKVLIEVLNDYKDSCHCAMCIDDIKAMALNRLPPQYICTEKGLLYTKANELMTQFKTDIIKEVIMAIEIVTKNPRHEHSDNIIA